MIFAGVADTHAALWLLFDDPRLSATAKRFFERAANERLKIALAPISLAETVYLVEKRRLPASAFEDLRAPLADPDNILEEAPFTGNVVAAMRLVPRDAVPDMPDRIVAATAIYFGIPVISKDGRIRASTVKCIW